MINEVMRAHTHDFLQKKTHDDASIFCSPSSSLAATFKSTGLGDSRFMVPVPASECLVSQTVAQAIQDISYRHRELDEPTKLSHDSLLSINTLL